jgi:hypothetical protein
LQVIEMDFGHRCRRTCGGRCQWAFWLDRIDSVRNFAHIRDGSVNRDRRGRPRTAAPLVRNLQCSGSKVGSRDLPLTRSW